MGFEVRDVAGFIQERRQVAHRGESKLFGVLDALNELFSRVAEYVVIDTGLVAGLAAQKLVDRNPEVLAHYVPHCDVQSAESAHDGGPPKMAETVHVLPVVLD